MGLSTGWGDRVCPGENVRLEESLLMKVRELSSPGIKTREGVKDQNDGHHSGKGNSNLHYWSKSIRNGNRIFNKILFGRRYNV